MAKFWLENNEVKSDMDLSVFDHDQMRDLFGFGEKPRRFSICKVRV